MKTTFQKIVCVSSLAFEKLATVLAEAQAAHNSRPILPIDSTDEVSPFTITPSYFLFGHPALAPPIRSDKFYKISLLRWWNLVHWLCSDIWDHWRTSYLQLLQAQNKWVNTSRKIRSGDVVLLKDDTEFQRCWPLARVLHCHFSPDGLVCIPDEYSTEDLQTTPTKGCYQRNFLPRISGGVDHLDWSCLRTIGFTTLTLLQWIHYQS